MRVSPTTGGTAGRGTGDERRKKSERAGLAGKMQRARCFAFLPLSFIYWPT